MKGMTLRAMTQAVNGIYHGNGEDYDKEWNGDNSLKLMQP